MLQLRDGADYYRWLYVLQADNGKIKRVEFQLNGKKAGSTDKSCLPSHVAEARRTNGFSEVKTLLAWRNVPQIVEACSEWITLHHANGLRSRVGRKPLRGPRVRESLLESARIRVRYRQGVEYVYELTPNGWTEKALEKGRLRRGPEPLMLFDVLQGLPEEQRQQALDLDPQGAADLLLASCEA